MNWLGPRKLCYTENFLHVWKPALYCVQLLSHVWLFANPKVYYYGTQAKFKNWEGWALKNGPKKQMELMIMDSLLGFHDTEIGLNNV